jgi:hypothetical protein
VPITAEGRRRRARAAALRRHHPDHPELAADDQRVLRFEAAERFIREQLGSRPALTIEQRCRLVRLLLPAGDAP